MGDREDDLGWRRPGGEVGLLQTQQDPRGRRLGSHSPVSMFPAVPHKSAERVCGARLLSSEFVPIPGKWALLWFMPLRLRCPLIIGHFVGKNCHAPLVNGSGLLPLHVSPSLGFIFPVKFGSIAQTPHWCGRGCAFRTRGGLWFRSPTSLTIWHVTLAPIHHPGVVPV